MSKFSCICGYVINLSGGWSNCEFVLVRESVIDKIANCLDGATGIKADRFYEMIDSGGVQVYRCPQCDRIHLQEGINKFTAYTRENRG